MDGKMAVKENPGELEVLGFDIADCEQAECTLLESERRHQNRVAEM